MIQPRAGRMTPRKTRESLLGNRGVFFGHHRRVKDAFTRGQINPVFFQADCML